MKELTKCERGRGGRGETGGVVDGRTRGKERRTEGRDGGRQGRRAGGGGYLTGLTMMAGLSPIEASLLGLYGSAGRATLGG